MTGNRRSEIERICQAALDQDAHSRVAFVAEACAGDDALRREVESLLARQSASESFIEAPTLEVAADGVGAEGSVAIGQSIGPYQVLSWLGAGGMGEVYRARDSKLGREVALKVLPPLYARESEWRARFRREAKVLASLGHPNIAVIYGFEESGDVHALVLELVEGPTLADRIAQGPIPLAEALPIAKQIAEALEAAHEHGVIHRDLKPANIKITARGARPPRAEGRRLERRLSAPDIADGIVKVLDFGLAKAVEPTGETAVSLSPSAKVTMTQPGMILGTAAYMSPEQARGHSVDKRCDLWAFGCVLYEMLIGKRAFGGDDIPDTIASVVKAEPDWSALPPNTPAAIRRLLRRALTKDPRNRLADASMARLEIEEAVTMPAVEAQGAGVPAERPRLRERAAWTLVAALVLAVVALSVPTALYLRGRGPAEPVRFLIDTQPFRNADRHQISISPDGRTVAYVAQAEDGKNMLYIRAIDSVSARPLAGTEGAAHAFWSPDGRHIGFQVGLQIFSVPNPPLRTVEAAGGPPQTVALCGTGTWSRDGVIICADGEGLSRVSTGGALTRVTTLDGSLQETAHVWPHFLPDGRHFLYLAWSTRRENRAIYLGALDSDLKTRLITAESKAVYAPSGFLLFHRQGTLFAQAFDATRLSLRGEPVRVVEDVASETSTGNGAFAVSSTGTLVYRSAESPNRQLAWFDREGRHLENVGPAGPFGSFALSPDEKRVALVHNQPGAAGADIWILEFATGVLSPLVTHPAGENEPVWKPDSQTVVFSSSRTGRISVFQRALGSREDVPVFESSEGSQWPHDWSHDSQFILINDRNRGIVALPTAGDRKPMRLLLSAAPDVIDDGQFSPDSRWLAYASTESGQAEVRVASFPEFRNIKQVSAGGGVEPRWRGDGKELFYITSYGQIMAVGVSDTGSRLDTTAPRKLFTTRVSTGIPGSYKYAASANGSRFLVLSPVDDSRGTPITVVLNWPSMLK
jgi:tRNA A-37 threonylcarbamoyl transferase component Bud32/dipeptidyl aminopeptidase/acylaminoacyl peptidase